MTDNEIEAGAKAICQCDEQDGAAPWGWYDEKGKNGYRERARAAFASKPTREPGSLGEMLREFRNIATALVDAPVSQQEHGEVEITEAMVEAGAEAMALLWNELGREVRTEYRGMARLCLRAALRSTTGGNHE